ncbi:hypothetical protein [Hippea alviniae]|uniref:hypothetical protein n=1 Tax=Hippea alviniae TaxID=1279027 RepID=UPI0003B6C3A1|nr:hypothetical protein [Hippea alviniae]
MNPAEIFIAELSHNAVYFIPLILDYIKPNDHRKTGHHFRVPFIREDGCINILEIPIELLKFYLPFQRVLYNQNSVKIEKIGEEKILFLNISREQNNPQKISQFPELSRYFKKLLKIRNKDEIDRQWVVRISVDNKNYYFPSTVLGTFFCFLSHKFTTNLFSTKLSCEVEKYGKNPPFIQLKPGYSNQYNEIISLYLYSTNLEAKENYDAVARKQRAKEFYSKEKKKKEIRYAFKFPFPTSGDWELRARVIPVTANSLFVAEILYVNTVKLLKTEFVEVRTRSSVKGKRLIFSPKPLTKSNTNNVYSTSEYLNAREYPETIHVTFTSPPAGSSVKIVKKIIKDNFEEAVFAPSITRGEEVKRLSNVQDHVKEGKAKRVRSQAKEKPTKDKNSRVFDLETVRKLMNHVALSLGIKMEYREFTPEIFIKVSKKNIPKLYYPKEGKRRVGVFYADLLDGKKMTAIFVDQKSQSQENYITSPILIGERYLGFPDEIERFFKSFMEISRKSFKVFCKRRGFDIYYKKPLQGNNRKDWENWVKTTVQILTKGG